MNLTRLVIFSALAFIAALAECAPVASAAELSTSDKARQTWQLLDYLAVDYGGAVQNGKIARASEYSEMKEFAATAEQQLAELPPSPALKHLQQQASELTRLIIHKAEAKVVADQAHRLASGLLKSYPFPVSPTKAPDLSRGAQLFQAQCASCHGAEGHGDGPLAGSLDPRPTALSDRARARERSVFALYQVLTQGVQGTGMPSFKTSLSDDDRWALAFFAGTLSYSDADRLTGASQWNADSRSREAVSNIQAVAQLSEAALATKVDATMAASITAYLRSNPQEAMPAHSSTAMAKARLAESLAAVERGDRAGASKLALSAYLDGFEPLEPALRTRDRGLLERVEAAMGAYRSAIGSGSIADVQAAEQLLQILLDQAQAALAPSTNDAFTTYIGALTILLREGLEALLVIVAMIAFLHKAQRLEALRYVHWGWTSALAAGGLTWLVATHLVGASGASRELTEGFSSLFAAAVLLGVGIWMHQKSVAGRWQIYLKQKMSAALDKRAAWFLFSLAFIAVYREVFETVLFYIALWTEGNGVPLVGGLASGFLVIGIVAMLLLRTSARLPIGKFFAVSSILVAFLAVVLVGKGIAGLQEAGLVAVEPITSPRIDVLGIYPSLQTLLAQAAVLLIAIIGFVVNIRSGTSRPTGSVKPT